MTATITRRATPAPAAPSHPNRRRRRGILAVVIGMVVLVVFALVFLYPFVIQIAGSFKSDADAAAHPLSPIPHGATIAHSFAKLFNGSTDFPLWTLNSVVVTLFVTGGRILLDSLAGYALSRLHFPGRGTLFAGTIAVMAVPPVVLLIPKFLVLNQLGIYDTYSAMILPLLADAGGVFIMKQFFETVPVSLEEAARIDGAGTFRIWWSVILPMAKPALITLTILSFQGSWNEFTSMLVAVQSPGLYTLPRGLADLVSGSLGAGTQYPLKLSAALLATIPVAIVFIIFQRRFVRGANEGGVKG
ncbi:MAG TPA: carbohydrate ABC transporter permease [Pseudonocardiaceae bacterium]|jgi:multiple sugar transport system permease protein|nr:carbohydrate ABC transporter permease [Pseudonocardiaceae bacterium]